jgi:hypothetical protein
MLSRSKRKAARLKKQHLDTIKVCINKNKRNTLINKKYIKIYHVISFLVILNLEINNKLSIGKGSQI